jgi:hypothetical protein
MATITWKALTNYLGNYLLIKVHQTKYILENARAFLDILSVLRKI